ncbi:MAG: hypothetical protein JNM86_16805 [Phycisphaerae bacterium]|nr:hypothetical protein [Phycisphaerae bacterium]
MKTDRGIPIESRWSRLGAGFYAAPAPRTPDVERLLLETVETWSDNPRLFPMVVTWLVHYSDFVAKHRLKRLISETNDRERRAALGLLLETAMEFGASRDFRYALEVCSPLSPAVPLYEFQRSNKVFAEIAEETASDLSKKWGLWAPEIELKNDAIRPIGYLLEQNPTLVSRVVRKGDLRASILESLRLDANGEARSESEVARLSGASRAAVGAALKALVLEGAVRVLPREVNRRDHRVVLLPAA